MKLNDSPAAAAFLYSLASELIDVKQIDDSTMIAKCGSAETVQSLTQSLSEKGYQWVAFEDYLVNKAE